MLDLTTAGTSNLLSCRLACCPLSARYFLSTLTGRLPKVQWTQMLTVSFSLAHETKTNASAHSVQYKFKISDGSPEGITVTMEERICERDEF